MANLIVEAIKGECKVEYASEDNPLNTQYVRTSQMNSVVRLLGELAMNGDLDCNTEGVGVICRMVSEELGDIVKQLDKINFEICEAISCEDDVKSGTKDRQRTKVSSSNIFKNAESMI